MDPFNIFAIRTKDELEAVAMYVFSHQYKNNTVYHEFCDHLGKSTQNVRQPNDIPYLPIGFFKSHMVYDGASFPERVFTSSGTTSELTSRHYVSHIERYEQSYLRGFAYFYGPVSSYCVLALLPSYLEREGSSLIYMVDDLIRKSNHPDSGFYLHDLQGLTEKLVRLEATGTKILLIGVSFALLNLIERNPMRLENTIIMETGGMKGRRKEMVREELHDLLKNGFGVTEIHSEYGMTELLSQAYSNGEGIFCTPPWMQMQIREIEDPFARQSIGMTGGINIMDLANVNSCAFIATQDLGKVYEDGRFEILGRFDHSDIRGCNLLVD